MSEGNGELEGPGYTYTVAASRGSGWNVVLRAIPTEGGVLITKDCVDGSAFDGREKLILGGLTFVPHEVDVDHLPENQEQIVDEMNEFAKQLVEAQPGFPPETYSGFAQPDFESMSLGELKKYAKEKGLFVGNKKRKRLVKDLTRL